MRRNFLLMCMLQRCMELQLHHCSKHLSAAPLAGVSRGAGSETESMQRKEQPCNSTRRRLVSAWLCGGAPFPEAPAGSVTRTPDAKLSASDRIANPGAR